jgi:cellulose biosynthesis protein BcsQ
MKKVIGFMNFKGGTGKTTLACLTALYLADKKKSKVRVHDLDQGGDTAQFVNNLDHDNMAHFDINEDQEAYDYIIVDTPGGITAEEIDRIADVCDIIVVPFALSATDIRRTKQTIDALHKADADKVRLLFNKVKAQTTAFKDKGNVLAALGVKAFKNHIGDRVGYGYGLASGGDALPPLCQKELEKVIKEIIK